MHPANATWWRLVREAHPQLFCARRVLEVGSLDINGSVRQFFDICDYTGVDWRPGPGVDYISLAHEMDFPRPFDVVISASMLEHDPYWRQSIAAMHRHLAPHGALLLSWGAAENDPHFLETAPDGRFHALPAWKVLRAVRDQKLFVERFMYEAQIHPQGGWGECGLVAFRDEVPIDLELISELRPADQEGRP